MSDKKPPVFLSAKNAYIDTARAITAMPTLTLSYVAVCLVFDFLEYPAGSRVGTDLDKKYAALLAEFVISLAWAFFCTPFFIAVHRFIVLGEVTTYYYLRPSDPRFLKFFGWTLFLTALVKTGDLLPMSSTDAFVVFVGFFLGILFVIIRSTILFPAVAVDAPGATLSNAFADTKGYFWRILCILMLTWAVGFVGEVLVLVVGPRSLPASMIRGATAMFIGPVMVAAASRLYERLGDQVKRPA